MINDEKLDFWFKNNRNVLFVGKHGCGKTSLVKGCFERNGLIHGETYLYFSASTLDPWVDLVGVPKESTLADGTPCLSLIRPAALASRKIEAIFFDEFNRSPKKVRNAVMELLQFKSINGLVFENLKVIWAAINPEDDDIYDVEKIDPAQKDRFHVIKEVEYKPHKGFFVKRFGLESATAAIEWWNELPNDQKDLVTPRRLEYALDEFEKGGSLSDILPVSTGITKLVQSLRNGPIENKIKHLYDTKDTTASKTFLANDNNLNSALKHIIGDNSYIEFFVPLFPKERLAALMSENDNICRFIATHAADNPLFYGIMRDIVQAGQDEKIVRRLRRYVASIEPIAIKDTPATQPEKPFYNKKAEEVDLDSIIAKPITNPQESEQAYLILKKSMPQNLSGEQAQLVVKTLAYITKDIWVTTLLSPAFDNIAGILNHCIMSISKENQVINVLNYLMEKNPTITKFIRKLQQASILEKVMRI